MANTNQIDGILTGSVIEDGASSISGQLKVNGEIASGFLPFSQSSELGVFSLLENGRWNYLLDNSLATVQGLRANTLTTDTFSTSWYDSAGGVSFAFVAISVQGRNDTPVIGGDTVKELNSNTQNAASGLLTISDADEGEKIFIAEPGLNGTYGTLIMNQSGTWSYLLHPNANLTGAAVTDNFSVRSGDGTGNAIKINLSGTGTALAAAALNGGSGNDLLTSTPANEYINGESGIDTAAYDGQASAYLFSYNSQTNRHTIADGQSGRDGIDSLTNVERLSFSDKRLALDLTPEGNAGKAMEFIGIIAPSLLNLPAVRGLIISLFDQGQTMESLCQLALDINLVPKASSTQLANAIFSNVTGGATPTQEITNFLASYIDSHTQANFLAVVAGMHINVDLVGMQQTGIEYSI